MVEATTASYSTVSPPTTIEWLDSQREGAGADSDSWASTGGAAIKTAAHTATAHTATAHTAAVRRAAVRRAVAHRAAVRRAVAHRAAVRRAAAHSGRERTRAFLVAFKIEFSPYGVWMPCLQGDEG